MFNWQDNVFIYNIRYEWLSDWEPDGSPTCSQAIRLVHENVVWYCSTNIEWTNTGVLCKGLIYFFVFIYVDQQKNF